ncbi:conserved hypothetical protein, secreted [Candidatus Magnetomorum sp. HK-1]|nr:conserved hypothetical protein, secreted [Candidatus Magnetomorum sp. HK-1]
MKSSIFFICFVSIFILCEMTFADLNSGLVVHYPFNGNANDESGNDNNGTVNGATLTTDRFGNEDKAYSFDGIDDNIDCGNNASTLPEKISISVWIKPSSTIQSHNTPYILGRSFKRTDGYDIFLFGNKKICRFDINDSYDTYSVNSFQFDEWHHIVMTYDGNTIIGYIDGQNEVANTVLKGPINYTSYPLSIGRVAHNEAYAFTGAIDDIRIYNRVISELEVQALYYGDCYDTVVEVVAKNNEIIQQNNQTIADLNAQINTLINPDGTSVADGKKILFTKDEMDNAKEGLFTEEQVIQEITRIIAWGDTNRDGTIGLEEAIKALRVVSKTE